MTLCPLLCRPHLCASGRSRGTVALQPGLGCGGLPSGPRELLQSSPSLVLLGSIQPISCLSATFFGVSSQELTLKAMNTSNKCTVVSCWGAEKVDRHQFSGRKASRAACAHARTCPRSEGHTCGFVRFTVVFNCCLFPQRNVNQPAQTASFCVEWQKPWEMTPLLNELGQWSKRLQNGTCSKGTFRPWGPAALRRVSAAGGLPSPRCLAVQTRGTPCLCRMWGYATLDFKTMYTCFIYMYVCMYETWN